MKNELQDKLVEILGGIQSAVSKGSDFVLTQLPDVAQQYVAFGRVWSIVAVVGLLVVISISAILIRYALTSKKVCEWGDWSISRISAIVAGVTGVVFSCAGLVVASKEALLVWFAPKVWLLIEIAKLVRH